MYLNHTNKRVINYIKPTGLHYKINDYVYRLSISENNLGRSCFLNLEFNNRNWILQQPGTLMHTCMHTGWPKSKNHHSIVLKTASTTTFLINFEYKMTARML